MFWAPPPIFRSGVEPENLYSKALRSTALVSRVSLYEIFLPIHSSWSHRLASKLVCSEMRTSIHRRLNIWILCPASHLTHLTLGWVLSPSLHSNVRPETFFISFPGASLYILRNICNPQWFSTLQIPRARPPVIHPGPGTLATLTASLHVLPPQWGYEQLGQAAGASAFPAVFSQ